MYLSGNRVLLGPIAMDVSYHTLDEVATELERGMSRIRYGSQMLGVVNDKDVGWEQFLHKWGLWD